MLFGAIALVLRHAVAGITLLKFNHDVVTGDLGDNGGAGNGKA